jgi:hypothetical protein
MEPGTAALGGMELQAGCGIFINFISINYTESTWKLIINLLPVSSNKIAIERRLFSRIFYPL